MTVIAFISTALLMLTIGWWIGIWCGRQVILDEKKEEQNISTNNMGEKNNE
jgi:hypothetical protein